MAKNTITKKELSDRIKLSVNRLTDNLESNLKVFKKDDLIASLITLERAENILQVSREIKKIKSTK